MESLSLRERNKQRVRERILAAAFDLFRSVGYDQATMDDIAAKAEVSRGTLFNYFPTKDALLRPFVQEIFQTRIRPALKVYLDEPHSTVQALRFLFMNIQEHVLSLPNFAQAFTQEFMRPRVPDTEEFRQRGELIDIIVTILDYGQKYGDVRTDIALDKLARYLGVLYISTFFRVVIDPRHENPNYVDEITQLLAFAESGFLKQAE